MQKAPAVSSATAMALDIIATVKPVATSSSFSGITHPGNWPVSAEFGVEYKCHDRQFPQVNHDMDVAYFDNVADLQKWLEEKREWIKGTDYDFSMVYHVYEWDWGPIFKYVRSM